MLSEHIKIPDRPDRDRSGTIGASEIAMCARRLSHDRAGTTKESEYEQSGFAERGHWVEKWWVARLRESRIGNKIRAAGTHQRTLHYGPISATPDAVFNDSYTADCKSFDPRLHRLPKDEHVVQIRLTARVAHENNIIDAKGGVLNYVNASDFRDIREFTYPPYDDDELRSAIDRADRILSLEPNKLPREGWITGGQECQECPFRATCLGEKIETVSDLNPDQEQRVRELHEIAAAAKDEEKAATLAGKTALDGILQILRQAGTRRAKGLAYIRRGKSAGKLDTEAMEADGIDLGLYRREGQPYESVILEQKKDQ